MSGELNDNPTQPFGRVAQQFQPMSAVPPMRAGSRNYMVRKIDLTNARINEELNVAGNFVWAYASSAASASVGITFNDQQNDPVTFGTGQYMGGTLLTFGRLLLNNAAQPGVSITIFIAEVPGIPGIEIGNSVAINITANVSTQEVIPGTLNSYPDVACPNAAATQVLAANANRVYAYIFNPAAVGTTNIRVWDSTVTASRGFPVPPQQGLTIATVGAIFVRNDTGGAINVPVTETARP